MPGRPDSFSEPARTPEPAGQTSGARPAGAAPAEPDRPRGVSSTIPRFIYVSAGPRQCRADLFLSWERVSLFVCELRHIALPRIDLLCRFSLDCDPSPMAGSFLRRAVRRLTLDSPMRWRRTRTGGPPRLVERLFRQSPLHRLNPLHVGCKKLAPALASMD